MPVLFNSACTQDKIKGDPKCVRIERKNCSGAPGGTEVALQEVASYFRGGKLEERMTYHSDGTLAYRWLYSYLDSGALGAIEMFDGTGMTRTVSRLDGDRPIESSGESRFDAPGRLVGNVVAFERARHGTPARIETLSLGDHVSITAYGADGETLQQTELVCSGDTTKTTQTINACNKVVRRIVTERVESRDSYANWTKKTSYESYDPNDEGVAIVSLHRTITYY